jgi:putative ABC transport system permease protein
MVSVRFRTSTVRGRTECSALLPQMTRLISGMLFGITATDPMTFVGVAALLWTVAFLANYLPARRASKVDSMVALRYE